jgi:hypothetical protein
MGSSSQPPPQQITTTQRQNDPWTGAQPYINSALGSALNLYGSGIGYVPFGGNRMASLDPRVTSGLAMQEQLATNNLGGTPDVLAGIGTATQQLQNYGITPQQQQLLDSISGQNNPYLENVLAANNEHIGDRINAAMSGAGRYGSGMHTDTMARALAQSADPILAQDYTQRRQLQSDILQGGAQRAGQWAQLAPTLDQAQYAPAQNLAAIGQFYTDRNQQDINNQIQLWNQSQARDWEQLARYNAIISGTGALGGTSTGTTSTPLPQSSTTSRLFGGALAGAGLGSAILPGIGTGIGALGGGLLGLL